MCEVADMKDILILLAILVILGLAAWYVIRSKKKGKKCIGCPDSDSCSGNCPGCQHK